MGGVVKTFTGKSGKQTAGAINQAGELLANATKEGTAFQVAAEQRAMELQAKAAAASADYLKTGNAESQRIAQDAQIEMQRIVGQSQFDQQSLANPAFKQRMDTIAQGFGQAIDTQNQAQLGQLDALRTGTQQAVQAGQPFASAGSAGISAFQQSALDPNNPLFNKRLAEGSEALNKQLAARGQFNSGAGLELQRDFIENATLEEQQNQINRQAQLAQLGQPQVGMQQQLLANQGQNTANVIGQGGQNIANLQTGGAGAQSDLTGQQTATNLQIQQNAANQQSGIVGNTSAQLANLATGNAANLANIASGAGQAQAVGESGLGAIRAQGVLGIAEAQANARVNAAKTRQAAGSALTGGLMSLAGAALPMFTPKKLPTRASSNAGIPLNSNSYSNIG